MNVNYKSDFKLFERGCDFTVPFTFEYRTVFGREYVASHIDGSYTNCSLQSDGRLMICFDNHNLSPGILTCTRHFYLTDRDFHNGICNLWDKRDTGIVLTIGKTDNCEIEVEVPPFYNQSKGDPGITPHIGENYNWWIGEEDTGVLAKGQNGATPSIGDNGNWWINGVDTGKPSRGVQGEKGNKGDKGDAGERGEQGQQGIQGPKGDEGDEGGEHGELFGVGIVVVNGGVGLPNAGDFLLGGDFLAINGVEGGAFVEVPGAFAAEALGDELEEGGLVVEDVGQGDVAGSGAGAG